MSPRVRLAIVGGCLGVVTVGGLAWATLAGWTTVGFRGDWIGMAAGLVALVLVVVTGMAPRAAAAARGPRAIGVAAFAGTLVMMWPAASVLYDQAVADAQAYCEALATGQPMDLPALAQPGFNRRTAFELHRSHMAYVCRFPDPVGARVHWSGEKTADWQWEKLMD